MDETELKAAYLDWIEKYCNNTFDKDNLPGGIKIALDLFIKIDPLDFNITSEKLSDMAQSFANNGDIPKYLYRYLDPYKRLRSL